MGRDTIVCHGQVEYVENATTAEDSGSIRIKVRLDSDGKGKATADLPWAWPLNPVIFHCVPKVGEGVFVLVARSGSYDTQRYYIGPIISQPQFLEKCEYQGGRGDAVSMLIGAKTAHNEPLRSINRAKGAVKGSFPEKQDIALLGRGQEDIILKYRGPQDSEGRGYVSEIDLRAGIRLDPNDASLKYLKGNVVFNNTDPAYIQVKHSTTGLAGLKDASGDDIQNKYEGTDKREAKALVNVVADKINLISHKDINQFGEQITDNKNLVDIDKIDEIMSMLHRSVYGDELVTLLKLIVNVLRTHTHPYSMLPPTETGTDLAQLSAYDYEKILSPNVRIS